MNFESFNLHPSVMAGIQRLGYTVPTPIQMESIPPAMQGRDIIGLAQTGTGKTAAFVLPILQRLRQGSQGRVRALIISPTRELAEQTCEVVTQLGRKTSLRNAAVYGGVSMETQKRVLRKGVEIVAACPGRLLDHLRQRTIDLSGLEILVIDEADRMFDMGFLPDVRSIMKFISNKHQTLLFSATMPAGIRKLVSDVLHDPVTVQIDRALPAKTVSHALYPVAQHLKTALLKEILDRTKTDSVLIFTRTKHRALRVTSQLVKAGYKVTSLQGNLSQNQRQTALARFRDGFVKILVATDIAARGLDVLSISHVINYDMPETTDDYIHRIGRTGRVEKRGDAFTLVTDADTVRIHALEQVLDAPLERLRLQGFDYTQPAPHGGKGLVQQPQRRGVQQPKRGRQTSAR